MNTIEMESEQSYRNHRHCLAKAWYSISGFERAQRRITQDKSLNEQDRNALLGLITRRLTALVDARLRNEEEV
jgi:hypothetical protein